MPQQFSLRNIIVDFRPIPKSFHLAFISSETTFCLTIFQKFKMNIAVLHSMSSKQAQTFRPRPRSWKLLLRRGVGQASRCLETEALSLLMVMCQITTTNYCKYSQQIETFKKGSRNKSSNIREQQATGHFLLQHNSLTVNDCAWSGLSKSFIEQAQNKKFSTVEQCHMHPKVYKHESCIIARLITRIPM